MGVASSDCGCCCGEQPPGVGEGLPEAFKATKVTSFSDDMKCSVEEPDETPGMSLATSDETPGPNIVRTKLRVVTQSAEEMQKIQAQQNRSKRAGISAQVLSQDEVEDFVKPVYPKTPEEEETIRSIIRANEKMQVLVGAIGGYALQDVLNAFFPKEFKQGDDVIRQGDEGDCLYICEEGQLDIFVARPGPDGKVAAGDKGVKVLTVGAGALFGELALMYMAPRAATVMVTSSSAKLWALEQKPFKMLLVQSGQQQFQQYEGWLSEVDILKSLNPHELSKIADAMASNLYDVEEVIVQQGEPGDCFYIVEDGTCAAFISGEDGEKEVKAYKAGDYFGEIALLTDEPRRATIRATDDGCTAISISKADFTNMLGPIVESLKANIDRYPRYAHAISNSAANEHT